MTHEQLLQKEIDHRLIENALRLYLQECIEESRSPDGGIMRGLNDSSTIRAFRRLAEIHPDASKRALLARWDQHSPPDEPDRVDLEAWRKLTRPSLEWRDLAYRQAAQELARALRLSPAEWVLRAVRFTCVEADRQVVRCHGFELLALDGHTVHAWVWWAGRGRRPAGEACTYWTDAAPELEQDRLAYLLRAAGVAL